MIGWFLGAAAGAVLLGLVNDEIRGWLNLIPRAILRLAALQLDRQRRETIYKEEWLPELEFKLQEAESRPITRLIVGITFSLGLVIAARHVARRVNRTPIPHTLARARVAEARAEALPPRVIVKTGGAGAVLSGTGTLGGPIT